MRSTFYFFYILLHYIIHILYIDFTCNVAPVILDNVLSSWTQFYPGNIFSGLFTFTFCSSSYLEYSWGDEFITYLSEISISKTYYVYKLLWKGSDVNDKNKRLTP